jgi:ADP-ribose pyrophosphatase YjhB (NUDIX family)
MPLKTVIKSETEWFSQRAVGVMLSENNRILLCRLEGDDMWILPGGGIRLHETLQEAIEREFLEEAKFEIETQHLIWKMYDTFWVLTTNKRLS